MDFAVVFGSPEGYYLLTYFLFSVFNRRFSECESSAFADITYLGWSLDFRKGGALTDWVGQQVLRD